MRHGYAGKRLSNPIRDRKRSLTSQGLKEVRAISKSLKLLNVKFDTIFSSPLPRALQTATVVANRYKLKNKIQQYNELISKQDRFSLYDKLVNYNQMSSILIVGHEPYLSTMISDIISNSNNKNKTNNDIKSNSDIILKKAGLSKIRITSTVPTLHGELRWLLTPDILKKTQETS